MVGSVCAGLGRRGSDEKDNTALLPFALTFPNNWMREEWLLSPLFYFRKAGVPRSHAASASCIIEPLGAAIQTELLKQDLYFGLGVLACISQAVTAREVSPPTCED